MKLFLSEVVTQKENLLCPIVHLKYHQGLNLEKFHIYLSFIQQHSIYHQNFQQSRFDCEISLYATFRIPRLLPIFIF
jgi:hypothetical protein